MNGPLRQTICRHIKDPKKKDMVQLTLVMGLCLGHDILFQKHIKSDCTTLVVKDRVYQHNPLEHLSKTS